MKGLFGKASTDGAAKDVEKRESKEAASLCSRLAAALSPSPSHLRLKPQTRKIFQTESHRNFSIDIDITTCVHGFLATDKKQPASLIIFAVQFVCLANNGAFNRIKLDLDFEEVNGSSKSSYPTVIKHAPYIHEGDFDISAKKIQKLYKRVFTTHADITLGAGPGAGVSETVTEQTQESFIKSYSGKTASSTRADKSGRQSGVWWNVKKSSDPDKSEDGINSNHHFAVLLTRDSTADFQARIRLFVDAGWRYMAENGGSTVKKIKGNSPNLRFSPGTWYEGRCKGIDRKRLGLFQNEGKLADRIKLQ